MLLYQLIKRKHNIDIEIKDLERCLYAEASEEKIGELFLLFNKRQDCSLLIHKLNKECCIEIDNNIISLEDAICIRDVLGCKIKLLTDLINNKSELYFSLNEQRRSLIAEYDLLKILILKKDLETEI